jgi:conjugative transfer region protein (TIGR03748 family)
MTITPLVFFAVLAASLAGCANHGIKPPLDAVRHAPAARTNTSSMLIDMHAKQRSAEARSLVRVGRYSTVTPKPTPEQASLLLAIIQAKMPPKVDTVGKAVRHLLRRSGFELADGGAMQPEVVQILGKKLPQVHRKFGPMTLEDALLVLVGPAFRLDVDHVHRVINFRLADQRETGPSGPGNAQGRVFMPAKHG